MKIKLSKHEAYVLFDFLGTLDPDYVKEMGVEDAVETDSVLDDLFYQLDEKLP